MNTNTDAENHATCQQALNHAILREEIPSPLMLDMMQSIMRGEVSPVWIAALLVALRIKGETANEIAAAARVMRELVIKVPVSNNDNIIDLVGTGGDGAQTFNISTCSAFVVSAAGATVAKHCGRSVSSRSGSADVLEKLGLHLNLSPTHVAACIDEVNLGFMFAPNYHTAMKHAAPVRRELGIRTLFNMLGPLTNPAGAKQQVTGVFSAHLVPIFAEVLRQLGSTRALIVHGAEGLDEISICGTTHVAELRNKQIDTYTVHPHDFDLPTYDSTALKVTSVDDSVNLIKAVLKNQPSAARDVVILNAGATLYTSNNADSIHRGIQMAREALHSGAAQAKLDTLIQYTQSLASSS